MKFNDILMAIDNNTKIRVTITQYGMKFSATYHYGEYFLDNKELDELTERRVLDTGHKRGETDACMAESIKTGIYAGNADTGQRNIGDVIISQ